MTASKLVMLSLAAILGVYLRVRVRRRLRRELEERLRAHELEWAGRGLDILAVSEHVHQTREDYIAVAQSRPHNAWHRRGLVASARHAMAHLSYFRRRKTASHHVTETHAA
jgi:hypothetical protein